MLLIPIWTSLIIQERVLFSESLKSGGLRDERGESIRYLWGGAISGRRDMTQSLWMDVGYRAVFTPMAG